MSTAQRGLGRGIDSLFRNAPESEVATGELERVPLRLLCPCANQPRKHFADTALEELAASIRSQGVLQPLVVRPMAQTVPQKYEIIAGERRWRAAKLAGLSDVPVLIREMSDDDVLIVALVENLQREDLNPLEEALALQQLRERLPLNQEELAAKLGKSRSAVANALRLLQLPESMREALAEGTLTPGHGRAVLAVSDETQREALFERILRDDLNVRDAEALAAHIKSHGSLPDDSGGRAAKSAPRAAKPESVRVAQSLLRTGLHPRASVSGSGERGKITIPYESADELTLLFERIGIKA